MNNMKRIIEALPFPAFVKDMNLKYIFVSKEFLALVGVKDLKELQKKTDRELFGDKIAFNLDYCNRVILSQKSVLEQFFKFKSKGEEKYFSISRYFIPNVGILGIFQDKTIEHIQKKAFSRKLEYYFTTSQNTYSVIFADIDLWQILEIKQQNVNDIVLPVYKTVNDFLPNLSENKKALSSAKFNCLMHCGAIHEFIRDVKTKF